MAQNQNSKAEGPGDVVDFYLTKTAYIQEAGSAGPEIIEARPSKPARVRLHERRFKAGRGGDGGTWLPTEQGNKHLRRKKPGVTVGRPKASHPKLEQAIKTKEESEKTAKARKVT